MIIIRNLLLLSLMVLGMAAGTQAAEEDQFLGAMQPAQEQSMGRGHSAIWTLSLVATQYQPKQYSPEIQAALQAQHEGRFLDALILLENAGKSRKLDSDARAEVDLLRASFLLQGNQSKQALDILSPLFDQPKYAADAYALAAMVHLQQGQMQMALDAARQGDALNHSILPHLALSYVLQGMGHLSQARAAMYEFNMHEQPSAISLAREAELALTLGQVGTAGELIDKARAMDAGNAYVAAVGGLVYLIDGHATSAKTAFAAALQRDPADAKALLGLGLAQIRLGNLQDGLEKLQAANDADPGNAVILTYLGRTQQQLGRTDEAMASWYSAEQADPLDPMPWLFQAQAALQANRLSEARDNLHQAQVRLANRSVYRGENLLRDDEQLLAVNLAAVQNRLGMQDMALHTLSDTPGSASSAKLRAQAEVLQGQRFGESARRSLLLQSLFDEQPGNLPAELDIYGDGAGLTGAQSPQHGVVSALNTQQASYNTYDSLFTQPTSLATDAIVGEQHTRGGQVRAGVGSEMLGLGVALRQYQADGAAQPPNLLENPNVLKNRIGQGIVQWRPSQSTQVFLLSQSFYSLHGETTSPWDANWNGAYHLIEDKSTILRLGLRQALSGHSEVRALVSRQLTDLTDNNEYISYMAPYSNLLGYGAPTPFPAGTVTGNSNTHSAEVQYLTDGSGSSTRWGAQLYRGPYIYGAADYTSNVRQVYAARKQLLGPHWQVDAQLAWETMVILDNNSGANAVNLVRWLPRLGLAYTPDNASHVRLAAWRDIEGDSVGDATLAPATLSGFAIKRPGERNNLVHSMALGADRQLNAAWLLEGQAQRRFADQPTSNGSFDRKRTDEARLALHWQRQPVAVSLACDYEYVLAPPGPYYGGAIAWDSIQEQRLRSQQLELRWFTAAQWTAMVAFSHNLSAGVMQSSDPIGNPLLLTYEETFNQVDASLDWRFNRAGSMDVGVRNAANRHFQYVSIDPLNPRFSNARLIYARLKLMW